MLHLAQHFESDGGMNHCNFLLPASNFKFFSQNILRLMFFSSKHNGFLVEQRLWREQQIRQQENKKMKKEAFQRLRVKEILKLC